MAQREDDHVSLVTIDVEDLVKSMRKTLQAVNSERINQGSCTIYRVLPSVRGEHGEDNDPKIISIGPFHRTKEALQPMEPLKWRYLQDHLRRCSEVNVLEKYIKKVSELEAQTRKHYSEPVELDSNAFVQMLVLDGCFIIEFLIKLYYDDRDKGQIDTVNWNLPLLRNDLLLLENQIPFFVLQSLFDLSNFNQELFDLEEDEDIDIPITLLKLAASYVTRDKFERLPAALDPSTVHHLLHLFHLSLCPTPNLEEPMSCSCGHSATRMIKKMKSLASASFLWLLSSFLYCRVPLKCWGCHQQPPDEKSPRAPRMIPSATELQESGVKFKRKEKARSDLDVIFRDGTMEIPVLAIQEATPPQFRNLIAFEQCCPASGSHFTSYAALLNNLIDTPRDVAILKESGIIESKLGQDEEVANLFNKLCKGAYLDFEKHYLAKIFRDVKEYCEIDRHKWRAGLMHDYFGNPWAFISLVAAIFLLILTVLQTYFTIYAYYRPPS